MAENKNKKRYEIRFEREAKALQKNLEKRKKQQRARENIKKAQERENTDGQD